MCLYSTTPERLKDGFTTITSHPLGTVTYVELHARRKRNEATERAKVAGEAFWKTEFSLRARARLTANFRAWIEEELTPGYWNHIVEGADTALRLQLGQSLGTLWRDAEAALTGWKDDLYPSLIEALATELIRTSEGSAWVEYLNIVLAEELIAFEFIEGQMVEFESREMHMEVVAPTLHLLAGRSGWNKVERSYQDALRELGTDASNAITDAGTALQEALTALGCEGNALGPLTKSAKQKGLLGPHDSALTDGVQRILDWVSANRSERGDGHKASAATRDDAWFAIHVVGALILRLASDSPR